MEQDNIEYLSGEVKEILVGGHIGLVISGWGRWTYHLGWRPI
jgi:hypothetical protein